MASKVLAAGGLLLLLAFPVTYHEYSRETTNVISNSSTFVGQWFTQLILRDSGVVCTNDAESIFAAPKPTCGRSTTTTTP